MRLNDDAALQRALHFSAPPAPVYAIRRRAGLRVLQTALRRTLLCAGAALAFGVAFQAPPSSIAHVPTPMPAPSSHVDV